MSILSDAAFSTIEVNDHFILNGKQIIQNLDGEINLYVDNVCAQNVNANKMTSQYYDRTDDDVKNKSLFDNRMNVLQNDFMSNENNIIFKRLQGNQNQISELPNGSITIGGELNECIGENSAIVSGKYNEVSGNESLVLSGIENFVQGNNSIAGGINSKIIHNNTFIWNNNNNDTIQSLNDSQFIINSMNGTMIHLPLSTNIGFNTIQEGCACWCWDNEKKMICIKTVQQNQMYKSFLYTQEENIKVNVNIDNDNVKLLLINNEFT